MSNYRKYKNWRRMFSNKQAKGPKVSSGVMDFDVPPPVPTDKPVSMHMEILPDSAFEGPTAIPGYDSVPLTHDVWARKDTFTKAHRISVQMNHITDVRPGHVIRKDMNPTTSCITAKKIDWSGKIIMDPPQDAERCAHCTKLPKAV